MNGPKRVRAPEPASPVAPDGADKATDKATNASAEGTSANPPSPPVSSGLIWPPPDDELDAIGLLPLGSADVQSPPTPASPTKSTAGDVRNFSARWHPADSERSRAVDTTDAWGRARHRTGSIARTHHQCRGDSRVDPLRHRSGRISRVQRRPPGSGPCRRADGRARSGAGRPPWRLSRDKALSSIAVGAGTCSSKLASVQTVADGLRTKPGSAQCLSDRARARRAAARGASACASPRIVREARTGGRSEPCDRGCVRDAVRPRRGSCARTRRGSRGHGRGNSDGLVRRAARGDLRCHDTRGGSRRYPPDGGTLRTRIRSARRGCCAYGLALAPSRAFVACLQ